MQKGHLFPIFRGPCRPSGRCTVGGATGASEVPFSAAYAAQEASAYLAARQASHSSFVELVFPLPMQVPTQRHVERWTASLPSRFCR